MEQVTTQSPSVTIGLDLGDRYSRLCVLDERGEVVEEGRVATTDAALRRRFGGMQRTPGSS